MAADTRTNDLIMIDGGGRRPASWGVTSLADIG